MASTLWLNCLSSARSLEDVVHVSWCHLLLLLISWVGDQCLLQVGLTFGLCNISISLYLINSKRVRFFPESYGNWNFMCEHESSEALQDSWKQYSWKTYACLLCVMMPQCLGIDIKLGRRVSLQLCQTEPLSHSLNFWKWTNIGWPTQSNLTHPNLIRCLLFWKRLEDSQTF